AALIGIGSSTFHPEASRIARLASGGRYGLAQSTFQVGGNTGTAFGPLLAAAIIIPFGQGNVAWIGLFALFSLGLLYAISRWYRAHLNLFKLKAGQAATHGLSRKRVIASLAVLAFLVFSKFFYMTSLTSYFTFYLIEKFDLSVASSQLHLFLFLGAVAAGTFFGGPIGDRIGRKAVIWFSILGAAPFTLALPYADLFWTSVLSVIIGFVLASAFSAIVVYAQELVPGNVGMIAGLFFGLMFGAAALALPCSAIWLTATASCSSTRCALTCRCSASSRFFCLGPNNADSNADFPVHHHAGHLATQGSGRRLERRTRGDPGVADRRRARQ
ncbi:fosmidomycin resistance protein, partial [Pseudomonas syringae pv. pisi str. 1704B]